MAKPNKPKAAYVTTQEGGEWKKHPDWWVAGEKRLVHSIQFEDGSVWDCVNGWRDQTTSTP